MEFRPHSAGRGPSNAFPDRFLKAEGGRVCHFCMSIRWQKYWHAPTKAGDEAGIAGTQAAYAPAEVSQREAVKPRTR